MDLPLSQVNYIGLHNHKPDGKEADKCPRSQGNSKRKECDVRVRAYLTPSVALLHAAASGPAQACSRVRSVA
eukprot:scaffold859_cov429-Prasinococcus_capsulatus_cf.AAC.1